MKKLIIIFGALILLGLIAGGIYYFLKGLQEQNPSENQTPGIKTYRNEEFGFEFQYPDNWGVRANIYGSPASKFNLIVVPPQDRYLPDPILVNITTPEFANRSFLDLENIATEVVVEGIIGKKYEYEFESMRRISIILPFGKYKMILGAEKRYEDVFNQILASFKFLK